MTKVLLVEDDPLIAASIRLLLKSRSFGCRLAPDGAQGLRLAADDPPDLILLDIMLPEVDGFTVCRRLRQDPGTRAIPILVVTSLANSEDVDLAYACGANDYLIKPFKNELLLEKIEKLLGASRDGDS